MGRRFRKYLDHSSSIFVCAKCHTHFCDTNSVVSDQFRGAHGQAFLVNDGVVNIFFGDPDQRVLATGLHIVRDAYCGYCDTLVGWTYDYAHEEHERYKTGKYVLEKALIRVEQQRNVDT